MKKLINAAQDVVHDSLRGLVRLNPHLRLLDGTRIIVDAARVDPATSTDKTVAVLSGGGAGHEPAHAGYVGPGMLAAAVSGEVFASPSVDDVLTGIRAVGGPAGVLLVVKNYTGDRLNFGLAAELARAEGIDTRMVIVADDVALTADGAHAGARGLAGTVLVHKVAGAAAAQGLSLAEVADLAEQAASNLATMGVALGACVVPASGSPSFELGPNEVEWGLGIHGEPGVERSELATAALTADRLLTPSWDSLGLESGDDVVVLINNLGGTSSMEMTIMADETLRWLETRGIHVVRAWCGSFLSSMEMPGCSISVLRVDQNLTELLDAATETSAWPGNGAGQIQPVRPVSPPASGQDDVAPGTTTGGSDTTKTTRLSEPVAEQLRTVLQSIVGMEPVLTEMDQQVGDGDLGHSLERGAKMVLESLEQLPAEPVELFHTMAGIVRRHVGGTSGPLYSMMLLRIAESLGRGTTNTAHNGDVGVWAAALRAGVDGIKEVGGAELGDRTMVDALEPAAVALAEAAHAPSSINRGEALGHAVDAARAGAEATADISARKGRSSYAGDRVIGHPDPGAWAVWLMLDAIRTSLN